MQLHPTVWSVTSAYLDCVDAEAPGLVQGLHLTGSVAMGDFQPGGSLTRWGSSGASSSDTDFVAVVSETAKPSIVAALARAHEQLRRRHRRPFFDGLYVTEEELAADSSQLNRVPQTHEGKLSWEETEPPSPVVWHELADHAVTLRGPAISAGAVWTNREVLVAWCRTNLENYWLRWLQHSRRFPDPWAFMALTSYGPAWAVLGVSRSHHTITTRNLVSKTDAGRLAYSALDSRWHRIIDESLRTRTSTSRRPLYVNPNARRRDTLEFVATVLQRHGIATEASDPLVARSRRLS